MSVVTGYAGDVSPEEAWARLRADPRAALVDVRTHPEWMFVGMPDLTPLGRTLVTVSWQTYPGLARNPDFAAQIGAAGLGQDRPLYLICRSGARSRAAAEHLTALGFAECWNVSDGFEGQIDADRHRGVGGWRAAGLPWVQS